MDLNVYLIAVKFNLGALFLCPVAVSIHHRACLVMGDFHVNPAALMAAERVHWNWIWDKVNAAKCALKENSTLTYILLCIINHSCSFNCRNYFVTTYWTFVIYCSAIHGSIQPSSLAQLNILDLQCLGWQTAIDERVDWLVQENVMLHLD